MNEIKVAVLGVKGRKSGRERRAGQQVTAPRRVQYTESVYHLDGKPINLQLYDPCSQAYEGRSTVNEQIQWAHGFIVVYDISDRSSFLTAKAIVHLIRELRLGTGKRNVDSLIFLVGNKQDLCHMREVRREEAQCLAAECRCQFYELSAAEHHQEVALIFFKMVQNANVGSKAKERRRRPSGLHGQTHQQRSSERGGNQL
ncbi:hypothetical protein KUCAC02_006293 [Chaenocephalus aceratus]|uniref:Uncharacterized protein n=1 Tax=Chaenocephalus aceratus TaxID=36190 RepID=A0ACB9VRM4_CHAAC|nr:hypothetical protein KUCAC02_006293 [Chaenocephalus aceratus]